MASMQETGPCVTIVAETKTGAVQIITDTINGLLLRQTLAKHRYTINRHFYVKQTRHATYYCHLMLPCNL